MNLYKSNKWKEFRDHVIELDGNKCSICGRVKGDVVLQVHHKEYIKGLKPWEYPTEKCITLCKGCHASEHGIVKPKYGWEYQGYEDLGSLIGICDKCGSAMRYSFHVFHVNWGTIQVGTYCCDDLTDNQIASNLMESQKRFEERMRRFVNSSRWKSNSDSYTIKQCGFKISINTEGQNIFKITIHSLKSSKIYKSLEEAKIKAFDVIESGEFIKYLNEHNISYNKPKKTNKK